MSAPFAAAPALAPAPLPASAWCWWRPGARAARRRTSSSPRARNAAQDRQPGLRLLAGPRRGARSCSSSSPTWSGSSASARATRPTIPKQVHGNSRLEIMWTIAPAVLLAVVAVPTVDDGLRAGQARRPTPSRSPSSASSGGGSSTTPSIKNADGQADRHRQRDGDPGRQATSQLSITSRDVIHSFWIPAPQRQARRRARPRPAAAHARPTSPASTGASAPSSAGCPTPTCACASSR